MRTQSEKGAEFYALHQGADAFIIPNPYDAGTARLLAHLGFQALATTSGGFAFSSGRPDYEMQRDETLAHAAAIVNATDLPVSADLENGFGDTPEAAAETIRQGAAIGLVGGSIEDLPGPYPIEHAADRIRASAEAVRGLPFRFTLTARAENYLAGRPDLHDTIKRLQAYQEAGADVLYAPGLRTREEIAAVVSSVDRPVNVLMTLPRAELSAIGVKRISVGSALSRAAMGAVMRAAQEMRDHGTFEFTKHAAGYAELNTIFRGL